MRRQALVLDSEDLLPAAGARWSGRGAGNQSGAGGGRTRSADAGRGAHSCPRCKVAKPCCGMRSIVLCGKNNIAQVRDEHDANDTF